MGVNILVASYSRCVDEGERSITETWARAGTVTHATEGVWVSFTGLLQQVKEANTGFGEYGR